MLRWIVFVTGLCIGTALSPVIAQDMGTVQSQIILVDTDRLFSASTLGQKIIEDYEAEREALIARNRALEEELSAEEEALTDQRAEMTTADFRAAADAFDEKAQRIRAEAEENARVLLERRDRAPVTFLRMVEPILAQLMKDSGAVVMLNARDVLLKADVVDVTDRAIVQIDAAFAKAQAGSPTPVVPLDPAEAVTPNAGTDAPAPDGGAAAE